MTAPYCLQPSSGMHVLKEREGKVAKWIIMNRHLEKVPQMLTEAATLWENWCDCSGQKVIGKNQDASHCTCWLSISGILKTKCLLLSGFCGANTPVHWMTAPAFRSRFETSIKCKAQAVFFQRGSLQLAVFEIHPRNSLGCIDLLIQEPDLICMCKLAGRTFPIT